jgi:hypothetical protein
MEVITIESEAFSRLILNIERLTNAITVQNALIKKTAAAKPVIVASTKKNDQEWLDSEGVCKILKVTKRTLQNYRDTLILPYSQVGKKILYKQSDIQKILESKYFSVEPP